jgi:hypothetical protein
MIQKRRPAAAVRWRRLAWSVAKGEASGAVAPGAPETIVVAPQPRGPQ